MATKAKATTTRRVSSPSKKGSSMKSGSAMTKASGRSMKSASTKSTKSTSSKTKKMNTAFMMPMQASDALAKVVGKKPMPRTEVTKKIWTYIKKHDLQDKKNRRNIVADDNLKAIFGGKKKVTMFEMPKYVSKNLTAAHR